MTSWPTARWTRSSAAATGFRRISPSSGSDNLLFSSMPQVSLTTIEHHPYIVAQSALTTLLNRTHMSVTNQSASSTARFQVQCQPNLIIRRSTGPARTGMLPGMPGPRF